MRAVERAGRAVGVLALALTTAACGTGGDGDAGKGGQAAEQSSGKAAPAEPVAVESKRHEITWTDLKDRSHVLRAAPKELARGSAADLKDVRLDDDLTGMVPYYLTVSYTNEGGERLERPAPERDFSLAAADGRPGEGISIFSSPLSGKSGMPEACAKAAPESVAAGGTATVCQIVMMPKNRPPAAVSYTGRDAQGNESDPVIWKAGDAGKGQLPDGMLAFGESAESGVQDAEGRSVAVEATPRSIRRGKAADLGRFELSADQKDKVPYYVTVRYRNNGKHKLLPQMNQKAELRAVSGQPARRLNLIDFSGDGLAQCPDARPDGLVEPKGSVTECSVFMLSKTDSPVALVFTGEGGSARTVTWQTPDAAK